ncbi:acyltransferase [Pontibacillus salipaludis]|uniref:acyltransferase n=1 Tax=Pontibacillus salipaludis TaxID=1697394 RepID=UPI0031EC52FF
MERNYAIDYVKFWAILFIVCIHTKPFKGAMVLGVEGDDIHLLINTFARFGVPFFFVGSGFLYGQKLLTSGNQKEYFNRYFLKLVKLFIYWYLFYILYGLVIRIVNAFGEGSSIGAAILEYVDSFIGVEEFVLFLVYGDAGGPASYHLWYLPALIWSILTVFVFIKRNRLNVLLGISLCLNLFGLLGQTYAGIVDWEFFNSNVTSRDAVFFGLFYTTLGCSIAYHYKWIRQKIAQVHSSVFVLLVVVFSITQIGERVVATMLWSEEIKGVDFYLSTIFLTLSLFLFVIKNGHIGKGSILAKVGKNAVGIYVAHTLFVDLTFMILDSYEVGLRQTVVFHLLFTPIVVVLAYLFYSLVQFIKLEIKKRFEENW